MFSCMECGRKFKTAEAAERAAFGDDGCPGCGGSDIDLDGHRPIPEINRFDVLPPGDPHRRDRRRRAYREELNRRPGR